MKENAMSACGVHDRSSSSGIFLPYELYYMLYELGLYLVYSNTNIYYVL